MYQLRELIKEKVNKMALCSIDLNDYNNLVMSKTENINILFIVNNRSNMDMYFVDKKNNHYSLEDLILSIFDLNKKYRKLDSELFIKYKKSNNKNTSMLDHLSLYMKNQRRIIEAITINDKLIEDLEFIKKYKKNLNKEY